MYGDQREILTNSKSINVIKNTVFSEYPELRPYSNNYILEREFGKNEVCGLNKITFILSPEKNVDITIVYCKEAS